MFVYGNHAPDHAWRCSTAERLAPMVFIVPAATVRLRNSKKNTRTMPAKRAAKRMITKVPRQYVGHGMQRELPSDRLRPGLQVPHSIPERPLAHCESAPFGMFKLILILEIGG